MNRPLSWSMRLVFALSTIFAIGTLSAGGISYILLSRELYHRLELDVLATAESLAHTAREGGHDDLSEQIVALSKSTWDGAALFGFIDAKTGAQIGSLPLKEPFEGSRHLLLGRDIPASAVSGSYRPDTYLAHGVRTRFGWVIVARDEAWVSETGELLALTTALALGVALLVSSALAYAFARRNEQRIGTMERVLDKAGAGQLDIRIADKGDDDLAQLAARVDRMLSRLEAGVGAIRQVSTDVTHDLRAPLARLRMRLEPLAIAPSGAGDVRREVGSALVDIDAISDTFDAILRLASLESGTIAHRHDPVDLGALAADVCDLLETSAHDAGHTLILEPVCAPVIATGDAELLKQALVNLVDNALRHSPPPARIVVRVAMEQGHATLSVSDDGPGIPAADRARVLQRFVRLDSSRTVPGNGLGLSLVAAIAQLHAGELGLSDNAPGLTVSLILPAAPAAA